MLCTLLIGVLHIAHKDLTRNRVGLSIAMSAMPRYALSVVRVFETEGGVI
jgi:hypothetical protein